MSIVLTSEVCIVLRGEIETLALEIARLASVGAWTAQSPDDALVCRVDAVE
jgi:hypothetical protein